MFINISSHEMKLKTIYQNEKKKEGRKKKKRNIKLRIYQQWILPTRDLISNTTHSQRKRILIQEANFARFHGCFALFPIACVTVLNFGPLCAARNYTATVCYRRHNTSLSPVNELPYLTVRNWTHWIPWFRHTTNSSSFSRLRLDVASTCLM